MDAGVVPRTTAKQRARNRASSGSGYAVPEGLREALHHGFIGPNLPPPRGMRWRADGGNKWSLIPLGG